MSITNRDPLVFDATFSPKAPQSLKKMLPVELERRSECDGLLEQVREVVATLGVVVGHRPHLSVDLREQLQLAFEVLNYFAVEGAEHQGLLRLEGRVERRVHLQDLLGVGQREKHHK
jgi:hypothetical protein